MTNKIVISIEIYYNTNVFIEWHDVETSQRERVVSALK